MSQLDRQRLQGNILDKVEALERKVRRLEETSASADEGGSVRASGLLIRIRNRPPSLPPAGALVFYAQEESEVVYLRTMDAAGVVRDLANWSESGQDVRVRHVSTDEWWRLYIDAGADGEDQFFWEEIV